MNKMVVLGALVALTATGCITVNKNDGGNSTTMNPVIQDKIHEKITVEANTTSATDKINCLFGFICWGSSATHVADQTDSAFGMIAKAKNGAYANACDAAKCDQIVGARYKVTTKDYFVFAQCEAEVTGYPAKLTGVEVVEDKDPSRSVSRAPALGFGF